MDTIVKRSLSKHLTPSDVMTTDPITFYVRLNNLHTMKLDEKTLKNILHHHVIPTNKDRQKTLKNILHYHVIPTNKDRQKTLKNILHYHVIPTNKDRQIKLISYLKPVKLCSFFLYTTI